MQIRAVACELPNPDYHLIFHAHISEEAAVWQEDDLNRYLDLQDLVARAYRRQAVRSNLGVTQERAIYNPGMSLEQALQRLIPSMVEANRTNRSSLFLHRTTNRVVVRRRIGIGDGYPCLRQVVLCKGGAVIPPELVHLVKTDAPVNSLAGRSDPSLVSAVLRSEQPDVGPRLKVVTLPAYIKVRLSANRSGEVLKEVARAWG